LVALPPSILSKRASKLVILDSVELTRAFKPVEAVFKSFSTVVNLVLIALTAVYVAAAFAVVKASSAIAFVAAKPVVEFVIVDSISSILVLVFLIASTLATPNSAAIAYTSFSIATKRATRVSVGCPSSTLR